MQQVTSEKHFLSIFQQRLKDQYLQAWYNSISFNSKTIGFQNFVCIQNLNLHTFMNHILLL